MKAKILIKAELSATFVALQLLLPMAALAQQSSPPAPPRLRGLDALSPMPALTPQQGNDASTTGPIPGQSLSEIRTEALDTEGAIFQSADSVVVKQPVLKALIQLRTPLSPYQLDAASEKPMSLRDTLTTVLENNLAIKVSHSDMQSSHWLFRSQLGGFLPSLTNQVGFEGLKGRFASPFGVVAPINNDFLTMPSQLTYNFFQGGAVLFGSLQAKHVYRATQAALSGATNDVLFDAARLYYQLALNDVLLQVRIKSVETSSALLARNVDRFQNGANTKLDVLQARTLLSKDKQNLITQQIARRQAAIDLATALNINPETDLTAEQKTVRKIELIDPALSIVDLVKIAIDNRPELKQYEQLRLAAKDAIKVARAPLYPTVQGSALAATTGARGSPSGNTSQSSTATNVAVGPLDTVNALPVANPFVAEKFTMAEIFTIGVNVNWTLGGMGTIAAANVQSAKWQARKAQVLFNQELAQIYKEVRSAYLNGIEAENLIIQTTESVDSAREQLNVANDRLNEGVGTDLDAVNAQRDYTNALVDKANAIIQFNTAQQQLLRSIGRISLNTATSNVPLVR